MFTDDVNCAFFFCLYVCVNVYFIFCFNVNEEQKEEDDVQKKKLIK
jgi:hypothetical protein